MDTLQAAATRAGLIDPDVLALARAGLAPTAAVAYLRRRYPGAFRSDARALTDAQFSDALQRKAWRPPAAARPEMTAVDARTKRAAVLGMSDAEFRAAVAARGWRVGQ